MIRECIVLAGGLGTRLRSVVADKPKCMAPVGNHPFLYYLLQYLHRQGITHVVLSLGYKAEQVIDWCREANLPLEISFAIEPEPLGTGGAILHARSQIKGNEFFITNGDTFFEVPLADFYSFHQQHKSSLSLALKPMVQFERYGSVQLDEKARITAFLEKQFCAEGLINGGIYLTSMEYLQSLGLPQKFSFEKEVLEAQVKSGSLYGFISDTYFIDIGIPADYEKVQVDLGQP
ncbi:D-glycero-alpha-D-manno-heptose 1-phosphate guanylyltransferase [Chitinophaga sp. CF118]|uniref:nucleotidyltransferase family protein n=1 Tax=Chitinophaga sp. CF118 TaxID=1884367 RepID=UPI0008F12CA4|nr:nucleotidyltransferase family protein [Chitinophaga sp. CF118]SFD49700.1 D-glycero-alpha-D-manno-heptose 1-phosphate guanylyltransferase [Chitinophaga sp. CF118]